MQDERHHVPDSTLAVAGFGFTLCILILIHSYMRNKNIFKSVRILTEVCAYSACAACIVTMIGMFIHCIFIYT